MGRHASVHVVFGVRVPEDYELPFDPYYEVEKWWLAKFVPQDELEDMAELARATERRAGK